MKAQARKTDGDARAVAALVTVLLVGMALSSLPVAFASDTSFNNVQVFVNTTYQTGYNFFFTAYNITGELVGSSQTPFPAAAFELPAGTYLLTVSAINQTYYGCYECVRAGYAEGSTSTTTTTVSYGTTNGSAPDKNGTSILPVPFYRPPTSEYGYQVFQVSGPASITINTQNTTQFPTSNVAVKVSFTNGTAAAGVWVSASIVGQWYYWWGSDSRIVMSAQTGQDGSAVLVLPRAPAVVSAWDWVKVNLPADQRTKPVDVGGQVVNVTVYWEPMYVGLAASALIIPPSTSVNLTLQYQHYNYWVSPAGGVVAPGVATDASAASVSKAQTGVPSGTQQAASLAGASSQYYLPTSIPSLQTTSGTQGATAWQTYLVEGLALGVAATAAAALSLTRMMRRKTP